MAFTDDKSLVDHQREAKANWAGASSLQKFAFFALMFSAAALIASSFGLIDERFDTVIGVIWASAMLLFAVVIFRDFQAKHRAEQITHEGIQK